MKLGEILAHQLALLPVRDTLLRTVVRTATAADAFAATTSHIDAWIANKARDFDFPSPASATSYRRESRACRIEVERSDAHFAFAVDHIDDRHTDRRWLTECVVSDLIDRAEVDVRLSISRPQSAPAPDRHAPRFLHDISLDVGLEDVRLLRPDPWQIDEQDVDDFLAVLLSPERSLAVVAVSESRAGPLLPTDKLAERLLGVAHTAVLTERASWAITRTVAKEWSVFLGAVRRYGPGLRWSDDLRKHRLWLPAVIERANAQEPGRGFLEACLESVFGAATADFETAISLITLRDVVREQFDAASRIENSGAAVAAVKTVVDHQPPQVEAPSLADTLQILEPEAEPAAANGDRIEELVMRVAALEEELRAERARNDDLLRVRDETIQSLQATNAKLKEDGDLYRSLADDFASDNERLQLQIALLSGEKGSFDGPMASVLRSLADALTRAHEVAKGLVRSESELAALRADNEALAAERADLARQRHSLETQIAAAREKPSINEATITSAGPAFDEPDRFVEYINERYGGSVVVSTAARKSFRDLVYLDPPRLYAALDVLGRSYLAMRTSGGVSEGERKERRAAFEACLREMRLTHGPSSTETGAGRHPEDHELVVDGRTLQCEKIRDIGRSFDPQRFLCIYFVWDQQTERIILKGFEHGDTVNAHT